MSLFYRFSQKYYMNSKDNYARLESKRTLKEVKVLSFAFSKLE